MSDRKAGLTDEQILEIQVAHIPKHGWSTNGLSFARAIEAAVMASADKPIMDEDDIELLAKLAMREAGEIAQQMLAPKQSQTQHRQNAKRIINIIRAGLFDIDRLAAPGAKSSYVKSHSQLVDALKEAKSKLEIGTASFNYVNKESAAYQALAAIDSALKAAGKV